MTIRRQLLLGASVAALLPVLAGCGTGSTTTRAETFAPQEILSAATFGARKTDPISISGDADDRTPAWIGAAVRRELEARGLSASNDPDLVGHAAVTLEGRTTQYVGWTGRHDSTPTVEQSDWTDGTLVIEFYDHASGDLAWRGVARGAVTPGAGQQQVDDAIRAMFSTWPAR